jgi:hypothetical protein
VRGSRELAGASGGSTSPNAEPLTVAALRRKLDAAIDAEAWPAVAVIRERIREAERAEACNVIPIDVAKSRR